MSMAMTPLERRAQVGDSIARSACVYHGDVQQLRVICVSCAKPPKGWVD